MSNLNDYQGLSFDRTCRVDASARGLNRHSLVLTPEGVKPLHALSLEDSVFAFDKLTGQVGFAKLTGVMEIDAKSTGTLQLNYAGGSITSGENNVVSLKGDNKFTWKALKELGPEDMLLCGVHKEEDFSLNTEMWVAGVLTSLGILTDQDSCVTASFYHSNPALLERVFRFFGDSTATIEESDLAEKTYLFTVKNLERLSVFKYLTHLVNVTEDKITISNKLWVMDNNRKLSFLLGVVDASTLRKSAVDDVMSITTCSPTFYDNLNFLIATLGIQAKTRISSVDILSFDLTYEITLIMSAWLEDVLKAHSFVNLPTDACRSESPCNLSNYQFKPALGVEEMETTEEKEKLIYVFTGGPFAYLVSTQGAPIFI